MSEQQFSALSLAVIDGDTDAVLDELQKMLNDGVTPQVLMEEHLIPAMQETGNRFEEGEFFVPELMLAARSMKEAMKILNPLLSKSGIEKIGRVVIGTVQGDLHDIGKNLVASLLEGGGFDVIDLGVDVPAEKFADKAKEKDNTIVCLSALLTTTMPQMKKVIETLQNEGIRNKVFVLVGGAPVTEDFSKTIGADGYSSNASAAVTLAKSLLRC
ncbi:corrinoid methyltransferase [Planctomycetales bacterium]|nr:corrinoid methyltransferase [Planctomycetales bacterium]